LDKGGFILYRVINRARKYQMWGSGMKGWHSQTVDERMFHPKVNSFLGGAGCWLSEAKSMELRGEKA
jgi:hypothetical protein